MITGVREDPDVSREEAKIRSKEEEMGKHEALIARTLNLLSWEILVLNMSWASGAAKTKDAHAGVTISLGTLAG